MNLEIRKAEQIREWIEGEPRDEDDQPAFPASHGTIRFLKSVSALYLRQPEARRNALSARPNISRHALSGVDQKLAVLRERTETGVFRNATLVPLLVGELTTQSQRQHDRLDTVITEATRILENRLRRLSKAPATAVGVDLARHALGGDEPRLTLSPIPAEQDAAHLLYRGVFGFIRNQVHHRLMGDMPPERTLQIVGMIDYLLSLLEAIPTRGPSDPADNPHAS